MTRIALGLALALATVALFDVVAWFAVPERLTAFSVSYRRTELLAFEPGSPQMARPLPRYYDRADDTMGFDINPGAKATHRFEGLALPIFANSLGCFDANDVEDFRRAGAYYYFAGDSFTWGFADYESKFATVWQRLTGKLAAKCGVAHTGQAQQFEKFKRVAAAIGKMPAMVLVGYYINDPANDAAYPHTTVIGGYQVDTVFLRDGALVRADPAEVRRVVEANLRELERPPTWIERMKTGVWVYSLSANIVNQLRLMAQAALARSADSPQPSRSPAAGQGDNNLRSRFGENLYFWYGSHDMKGRYASDPKTEANRAVIERWARHARENSYRLIFILIPPKDGFDDTELFAQVRQWLEANRVEYLDLAALFKHGGFGAEDLYWKHDSHWNANGNRVVGKLLAERY